jgi:hypothetical protein
MHTFDRNCCILCSFIYNPPEDGLIEAETYRRVIVDDQLLFIIDDAICWK